MIVISLSGSAIRDRAATCPSVPRVGMFGSERAVRVSDGGLHVMTELAFHPISCLLVWSGSYSTEHKYIPAGRHPPVSYSVHSHAQDDNTKVKQIGDRRQVGPDKPDLHAATD